MTTEARTSGAGRITAIRGSVVDVHFGHALPPINQMLRCGQDGRVAIEVADLLGPHAIRGIALNAEQDLALGMEVIDTGEPVTVPVGRALLGRMLNMFGEPIDGGSALGALERRPIHHAPVPLARSRAAIVRARRSSRVRPSRVWVL